MSRFAFWIACAVLVVVSVLTVSGQETEKAPADNPAKEPKPVVSDEIKARLKKLEDSPDFDPVLKQKLQPIYAAALESLRLKDEADARTMRYISQTKDVPDTTRALKKELAEPAGELAIELLASAPLSQWQQELADAETELTKAQTALKEFQDEPKRRADRRAEIPELLESVKTQLQTTGQQIDSKPPADEPPELTAANRLAWECRKQNLLAEQTALQAELRFYETAVELLSLRRDSAARQTVLQESLVKRFRDEVNERRRRDAERQSREARRIAAAAHPELHKVADRIEELAKLRQEMADKIEIAVKELDELKSRLNSLDQQFSKIKSRVEVGHQGQSIGLLLRKERGELPDVTSESRKNEAHSAEITTTSLELIDFEEQRNELATIDGKLEEIMSGLRAETSADDRAALERDVRDMLRTQRSSLDAIISDANSYLDSLTEQHNRRRELIAKTREYADFYDERIFWIRSATWAGSLSWNDFATSARWLGSRRNWTRLSQAVWKQVLSHPWEVAVVGFIWLIGLAGLRPMRKALADLGDQAQKGSCRTYLPTARALLLTLSLVIIWPVPIAVFGLELWSLADTTPFLQQLGKALVTFSLLFAGLALLRKLGRPLGLAISHFSWDASSMAKIRYGATWAMLIGLPLAAVVLVTEAQVNESVKNSLGRVVFLALMTALLIPMYRLTHPTKGVLSPAYEQEPTAWWSRLKYLWPMIGVGAPLLLLILAISGFYYTAVQLAGRFLLTAWLLIGLAIVYGLLMRWSLIAYRNLGMQRLQERRAAAEAASATTPQAANMQFEIKLSDINQQTRSMVQWVMAAGLILGIWWIWADVIPAFGALRHWEIWTLESAKPGPGGTTETVKSPITLADLILSAIMLALTVALSRNAHSLLELTILKRLPMDAGARYATATVARYLITGAGVAAACGLVGLQWSQVQWLVAAFGVGLGFGLQEIFANFVSGLILLFERPIRIGDIVTVGDIDGKVSDIRMRATTITDWDMRELIVPNKEFVTGRVINWTLSSTVSRMSIAVGVAYGSNPDQVRELLLDIAKKHPMALKDPAPHALLDGFGDSTLNFVLRVHMATRDVYLQLRHELMREIAARFNDAGIVIAFPQRDIHVYYESTPGGNSFANGAQHAFPFGEPQRSSAGTK